MYGISTIKKILFFKDREKLSIRKTAERFYLSPNTVFKWNKGLMPKSKRICKARKLDMERLKEDMNKHRDLYQYERAEKFKVSQNCIHKGLKRLGISYKTTFQHPKANEEERMLFQNKVEKYESENRILSYIDESGFAFDIPRRYGYSKVGDRCYSSYNWSIDKQLIDCMLHSSWQY